MPPYKNPNYEPEPFDLMTPLRNAQQMANAQMELETMPARMAYQREHANYMKQHREQNAQQMLSNLVNQGVAPDALMEEGQSPQQRAYLNAVRENINKVKELSAKAQGLLGSQSAYNEKIRGMEDARMGMLDMYLQNQLAGPQYGAFAHMLERMPAGMPEADPRIASHPSSARLLPKGPNSEMDVWDPLTNATIRLREPIRKLSPPARAPSPRGPKAPSVKKKTPHDEWTEKYLMRFGRLPAPGMK